ncbi:MAG: hypothetical protein JOZ58_27580 [Acetobacteraceae bacterium]|jgi:hypothetical protein|nr:hypothetical protein [Acetobacteraceae bacterium]
MEHKSTRKTGNEPVEGADPGGTRPTKPGQTSSSGTQSETWTEHKVESGDRNTRPPSPK